MRAFALLLAVVPLAGCVLGAQPAAPRSSPAGPPVVYAAIGASETVGIGTDDPVRESFPQKLLQRLGVSAVFYDFGIPSETTQAALKDELPPALDVRPTLATVWLNVDDLIAGVPVAGYEQRLDELVGALSRAGARVLVANTPQLIHLPAYAACRPNPQPGSIPCPLNGVVLPPPDQVTALTAAYNAAIAAVVQREGATLVDLFAAGDVPDLHPEYVGRDGFHPSAAGAAAIAATFAAALATAPARG